MAGSLEKGGLSHAGAYIGLWMAAQVWCLVLQWKIFGYGAIFRLMRWCFEADASPI